MSSLVSILSECVRKLRSVEGIREVLPLSHRDRWILLRLEEQAERKVLMGMMPGINLGLRAALEKEYVLAAITDMNFKWPLETTIRIKCGEDVIGEEVRGKKVEELRDKGYVIVGSVAFRKDALRRLASRREECILEILPLKLPLLSDVEGVREVVVGSPSPPADEFIKRKSAITDEKGLGSVVLGFDVTVSL